ncbi:DUF1365 domain-containing protein [candidate division KSB1 bacterium]
MIGALYTGKVRHHRYNPFLHAFSYRLFMVFLNVDEIDQVFKKSLFWNTNGKAIVEFRRSDYLFDQAVPVSEEVKDIVEKETGKRPEGSIYMLTHLRYFGYNFNPVTFYYCYDKDSINVETIVAQVTNTPWKERFCYVLDSKKEKDNNQKHHFELDKIFHVSPFIDMNHRYKWSFTVPGKSLTVHMENHTRGKKYFDATLTLKRKPLTKSNLRKTVFAFPFMTLKVVAAIYWQALKLKLKGAPFFEHPQYRTTKVTGEN